MREGDTFATRFLCVVILLSVFLTGIFAVLSGQPGRAEAAGTAADSMCLPKAVPPCGCGMSMGSNGCKADPSNKFGCPCQDTTNGFTTSGTCTATFKCTTTGGAGQPQIPMIPMPPPPSPSPPTDPCSSGIATTSTSSAGCAGSFPNYDIPQNSGPVGFNDLFVNTPTGSTNGGTNAINDLVSSLLNGTVSSNGTTVVSPPPPPVSGSLNTNVDSGAATSITGSIVPGTDTNTNTSAQTTVKPFGSAEGISGDVQLKGNFVTLMVSNRDTSRGTQVSGQYGFAVTQGSSAATVFKDICGKRPWASNFLSFIIPSSFFDGLCKTRGYAVGVTAQAAVATQQTTTVAPAVKPPPPAPAYLGPMRAEIWAVPPSVAAGQKTSLFWYASGVSACTITTDVSLLSSSIASSITSPAITKNTTFYITCTSATSTVANQVVVAVQ